MSLSARRQKSCHVASQGLTAILTIIYRSTQCGLVATQDPMGNAFIFTRETSQYLLSTRICELWYSTGRFSLPSFYPKRKQRQCHSPLEDEILVTLPLKTEELSCYESKTDCDLNGIYRTPHSGLFVTKGQVLCG